MILSKLKVSYQKSSLASDLEKILIIYIAGHNLISRTYKITLSPIFLNEQISEDTPEKKIFNWTINIWTDAQYYYWHVKCN